MREELVGLVGLSDVGAFMAHTLARHGWRVVVYDSHPQYRESFYERGPDITVARSLASLGRVTSTIICAQSCATEVRESALGNAHSSGFAATMRSGGLIIDTTPSTPDEVSSFSSVIESLGHHVVDAPVTGNARCAATGNLAFTLSGEEQHVTRATEILTTLGTLECVGDGGAARVVQNLQNYVAAATIAATSEALQIGRELGLDKRSLDKLLEDPLGSSGLRAKLHSVQPEATSTTPINLNTLSDGTSICRELAGRNGLTTPALAAFAPLLSHAARDLGATADLLDLEQWLAEPRAPVLVQPNRQTRRRQRRKAA